MFLSHCSTDSFFFVSHHVFDDVKSFISETQNEAPPFCDPNGCPPDWVGANPDAVLACPKALKETVYAPLG